MAEALLRPLQVGKLTLKNRIIMAPLTRCRANDDRTPSAKMVPYYQARASAGLIISEATLIDRKAGGFPKTPSITPADISGWKDITDAIHTNGGAVACQLWHQGRTAAAYAGGESVGPSAIEFINGMGEKTAAPRELTVAEIKDIVQSYRQGAKNAMDAGFDLVEIHAANGYLPNQFLVSGANKRTDEYGGSIENRARFLFEVVEQCIAEIGADRVAVRLSPASHWQDIQDEDPIALYKFVNAHLENYKLAYLHIVEPRDTTDAVDNQLTAKFFRDNGYTGVILSASGHTLESGEDYIKNGKADAVVYGRFFISNPDLVKRFTLNKPLNDYNRDTFYSHGDEGYLDYPTLDDETK